MGAACAQLRDASDFFFFSSFFVAQQLCGFEDLDRSSVIIVMHPVRSLGGLRRHHHNRVSKLGQWLTLHEI